MGRRLFQWSKSPININIDKLHIFSRFSMNFNLNLSFSFTGNIWYAYSTDGSSAIALAGMTSFLWSDHILNFKIVAICNVVKQGALENLLSFFPCEPKNCVFAYLHGSCNFKTFCLYNFFFKISNPICWIKRTTFFEILKKKCIDAKKKS